MVSCTKLRSWFLSFVEINISAHIHKYLNPELETNLLHCTSRQNLQQQQNYAAISPKIVRNVRAVPPHSLSLSIRRCWQWYAMNPFTCATNIAVHPTKLLATRAMLAVATRCYSIAAACIYSSIQQGIFASISCDFHIGKDTPWIAPFEERGKKQKQNGKPRSIGDDIGDYIYHQRIDNKMLFVDSMIDWKRNQLRTKWARPEKGRKRGRGGEGASEWKTKSTKRMRRKWKREKREKRERR